MRIEAGAINFDLRCIWLHRRDSCWLCRGDTLVRFDDSTEGAGADGFWEGGVLVFNSLEGI
jgi:hypothetical protein